LLNRLRKMTMSDVLVVKETLAIGITKGVITTVDYSYMITKK